MAIINCPECDGAISDKAKFCVHCGCSIFVCSECGKASTQKTRFCEWCGAPFDTQEDVNETEEEFFNTPTAEEKKEELPNIFLLLSEFKASGGANGFMYKGVKIIRTILTVFTLVCTFGGLLLAFSYLIPNINIPFSRSLETVLFLFILGDVLGFLNNIFLRVVQFYTPLAIEKWILKKGLDAKLILKALLLNGTAGELSRTPKQSNSLEPESHHLATAALHIVNGEKSKTIAYNIVSISLYLLVSILGLLMILVYLTPLLSVIGGGFDSQLLGNVTSLIVFNPFLSFIILSIMISIGSSIFNSVWHNKKKAREAAWLHQNLPECFNFSNLQDAGTKSL